MRLSARARQTFNDVKTVGIPAFAEARTWIERICTGHVDPQIVLRLVEKAKRLMESRKATAKRAKRPGNFIHMSGDATVIRRPSGLYVQPKYKDV